MSVLLNQIYKHYIKGECVDKAADKVVRWLGFKILPGSKDEFSEETRGTIKTALLCVSTSTIALATYTNPWVSIPVGCTIGGVATVPFVGPIYSSLKSRVKILKEKYKLNLTSCTKLKSFLIYSLFLSVHAGVTYYWMSTTNMKPREWGAVSIASTNVTMNGAAYVVNKIIEWNLKAQQDTFQSKGSPLPPKSNSTSNWCWNRTKKKSGSDAIDITGEIEKERDHIAKVRYKIFALDSFVRSFPELERTISEELVAKPYLVDLKAILDIPENTGHAGDVMPGSDDFRLRIALYKEAITLEYSLGERIELIQRSDKIMQCFTKHWEQVKAQQGSRSDNASVSALTFVEENLIFKR